MFPRKISFFVINRRNTFAKNGSEWALQVSVDERAVWTITTFEKKPTKAEVDKIKEIVLRSCEVYHYHIKEVSFQLKEENENQRKS